MRLRFYQDNLPPVLSDGINDIGNESYVIGAPNDPHWKLYPKDQFLTARNMFPIAYAFTDYSADSNHFAYYMPENAGPTFTYSRLLRDHFEKVHGYRQQYKRENERKLEEERNAKINQLNGLLYEQSNLMKKYKSELANLKSSRDREIRSLKRSGMTKEEAEIQFDTTKPLYINTLGSISLIQSNISTLKKELKNYTD